ncbi:MAG: CsbD family protein [Ilumatobacteraceae bacterium]
MMGKEVDKAKGKIKQAVGDLTGNKDLKKEGKADERAGKAKGYVADAKNKAEDVVDKVKDKVTKR